VAYKNLKCELKLKNLTAKDAWCAGFIRPLEVAFSFPSFASVL